MNIAQYNTSAENSIKLFKRFELFSEKNYTKHRLFTFECYSEEFMRASQKSDYEIIYKVAIKNNDYDYILNDGSILQFTYEHKDGKFNKLRYAFYQSPYKICSYKEFLYKTFGSYHECDSSDLTFLQEYEQYIDEAPLNPGFLTIRYDYDESLYLMNVHSTSHIHIGHNNTLRIDLNKILTPKMFVAFIIKNAYFDTWKKIQEMDKKIIENFWAYKTECEAVDEKYFAPEEFNGMILQ